MLTTTETIVKPLTATEKIALDNQQVCEAFVEALKAGDKKTATEYAKVIMLKAMCLWGFPQVFPQVVENSKSQKSRIPKNLKILKSQKSSFFRFLTFLKNLNFKIL